MIISLDRSGTVAGLSKQILEITADPHIQAVFILAAEANKFSPAEIDPLLKKQSLPLFGGIFPAIIYDRSKLDTGTIVVGITQNVQIDLIENLSSDTIDFEDHLDQTIPQSSDLQTMLVFVDGFAKRIGSFIDSLFNIFGLEVNYIGGGAGSLSFIQQPCLFTNKGLIQDGALLARLQLKSGIGVSHGWQKIQGPFRVTESNRNTIETLDWTPAFDLYRSVVEKSANKRFTNDNFFDLAKAYPFGIAKLDAERVVRDPLMVGDNGALVCVGEVPKGSFVDILNGDDDSLVEAAGMAGEISRAAYNGNRSHMTNLFIDCISRVLFLGSRFDEELSAVYRPGVPLIGVCSLGEIANNGDEYLEFYNKTAVMGTLETL